MQNKFVFAVWRWRRKHISSWYTNLGCIGSIGTLIHKYPSRSYLKLNIYSYWCVYHLHILYFIYFIYTCAAAGLYKDEGVIIMYTIVVALIFYIRWFVDRYYYEIYIGVVKIIYTDTCIIYTWFVYIIVCIIICSRTYRCIFNEHVF